MVVGVLDMGDAWFMIDISCTQKLFIPLRPLSYFLLRSKRPQQPYPMMGDQWLSTFPFPSPGISFTALSSSLPLSSSPGFLSHLRVNKYND